MEKTNVKELIQQAEEDLQRAHKELYQPMEDVVTFSACVFTRRALYNYLMVLAQIHAKEHGESPEETNTIEKLVKFNRRFSNELNDIDFSQLNCKCDDVFDDEKEEDLVYCTSVDKVNYCTELSDKVREILTNKAPELLEA